MDDVDAATLEKLRTNASLAVEQLQAVSDVRPFGYDRASVAWVEGFVERQRLRAGPHDGLVNILGSYLGEAVIRAYGGQWVRSQDGIGVKTIGGITAFPFAKVRKQFDQGLEGGESMLSFFTVLPVIANRPKPVQTETIAERAPEPCVILTFVPTEEDAMPVGASRFGGDPDLPHDLDWPTGRERALSFLLQIDLAEVAPHDSTGQLPKSGFLWFFMSGEGWGHSPRDRTEFAVVFADVGRHALGRYTSGDPHAPVNEPVCAVTATAGFSRAWDDEKAGYARAEGHRLLGVPRAEAEEAWQMAETCARASSGGEPLGARSGARSMTPEWSRHVNLERERRREELERYASEAKDWHLLLQVDSDEAIGLNWFDTGTLYFWIREDDLAARRFEKAWFIVQSL